MAHRFIIDDQTGQLYKDFTGRRLTSAAEILKSERGLTPTLEFYLINVATDTGAVTAQTLTNAQLSVAIGSASTPPDSGFIKASFTQSGTLYESEQLNIESLTAASLESAFNSSIQPVYNVGGLTVDQIGPGKWLLTMKKVGAITGSPSLNVENSDPPSGVEVTSITTGDSDTRAQWIISLAQLPVASIAGGSFSAVTSGSFSGLSSSIALNTTGMLAAIARDIKLFEFSVIHNNQVLHRSTVEINESLDPTAAGTVVVTSPSLFTLGSNAVNQGETIALSGGLTYDGTTLAAPFLPLAGGTMTGALNLGDNINAQFGDSQQLKIYHNGANNGFIENSTAYLVLESSNIILRNTAGNEDYAKFLGDGAVELYYNNSKKFETTSLGATISGKLIVNGDLDVSGTTTTFNSTVVTVDDPVFTVGGDTAPVASDNKDRGIEFRYMRSGESAKVGFFGYSNADDAFTFLTNATNNSEVFSGTLADLKASKTLLEDGSANAPSVSFSSDNDTGIYRASGNLAFSTGGTEAARFDSSGDFITVNNIKIPDGKILFLGDTSDLQIYHNGFHSSIDNYTSDLYINNRVNGGRDIIFRAKNSSDVLTELLRLDGSASSINVPDDVVLKIGNAADMQIVHSGSNNIIKATVHDLIIENAADDKDIIFRCDDGSGGTETYFLCDGSASSGFPIIRFPDNSMITLGTDNDLYFRHDGTNTYLENNTGDFYIRTNANDKDIIFQSDNGSGGVETYFYLDGSASSGNPITVFPDNSKLTFGDSYDLRIFHDGENKIESLIDLRFKQQGTDKDFIFEVKPSGVSTEILRLDGSASSINVPDDVMLKVGSGGLSMEHKSNNETWNYYSSASGHAIYAHGGQDQDFIFKTTPSSTGSETEILRLDGSNSRIGVSTSSPRTKFHIVGDDADDDPTAATAAGAFLVSNSAGSYGIEMGVSSSGDGWIQSHSVTANLQYPLLLNPLGGNVGIGGTPSAKLHVFDGDIRAENRAFFAGRRTESAPSFSFHDDSDTGMFNVASNILAFATSGSEAMRITSSGNVGINCTPSVTAKLEVNGNINTSTGSGGNLTLFDDTVGRNNRFLAGADADGAFLKSTYSSGGTGRIRFETVQNERMRIEENGNVGINDIAPQHKLQIDSNGTSAIQLVNSAQTSSTFASNPISILFGDEQTGSSARHQASINCEREAWASTPAALTFKTAAGVNAATERMRIDSSGNVGIGTENPDNKTEISGTDSSTTDTFGLKISNTNVTTNSNSGILFKNYDNHGAWIRSIRTDSANGKLSFGTNSGAGIAESNISEKMVIDHNGDVEIKTDGKGLILNSANGTAYKITVANDGTVTSTAV